MSVWIITKEATPYKGTRYSWIMGVFDSLEKARSKMDEILKNYLKDEYRSEDDVTDFGNVKRVRICEDYYGKERYTWFSCEKYHVW